MKRLRNVIPPTPEINSFLWGAQLACLFVVSRSADTACRGTKTGAEATCLRARRVSSPSTSGQAVVTGSFSAGAGGSATGLVPAESRSGMWRANTLSSPMPASAITRVTSRASSPSP